jgi:hypothetical protein
MGESSGNSAHPEIIELFYGNVNTFPGIHLCEWITTLWNQFPPYAVVNYDCESHAAADSGDEAIG